MNTELLQENRSLGFANAESAPPHFAARIIEIRRAVLEKRAVPEPSAEYRMYAERNYVAPRVRVKPLPASMITETLQQTIDRQARQIRADREAFVRAAKVRDMLTDFSAAGQDNWRHHVEGQLNRDGGAVSDPQQLMRCSSLTSSREDHEYGVQAHANIARKLCDRKQDGWADAADRHFAASGAHRAAAADPTPENCGKAVVACQRAATTGTDDE